MHKKLEAELVSLAHSILQMKNREDVYALHAKAHKIYEKLSVLKFVEDYVMTTPQAVRNKDEILEALQRQLEAVEEKPALEAEAENDPLPEPEPVAEDQIPEELEPELEAEAVVEEETPPEPEAEEEAEEEAFSLEMETEAEIEEEEQATAELEIEPISEKEEEPEAEVLEEIEESTEEEQDLFSQTGMEEELQRAAEIDEATALFEKATRDDPVIDEDEEEKSRSLNDALFKDHIQVGLNDRIAFVKHLFDNSQEDFNRVLSQLNSFKTEKEARQFVKKFVKPDYDWSEKEEYEERLMELIERKFA
jgi:hypothetical protein